jgi:polyisoprenoid-binding protein YceI
MFGFAATALLFAGTAVQAETFKVDPAHTSLAFSVRHLGINDVKVHFDEFAGVIMMDKGAIKEASFTIQVKSINTGVKQRDDHLRSADFFDADKHPTITFKTKSVEKKDDQFVIVAEFTIRGVTKEVRVPVKLERHHPAWAGCLRVGDRV